MDSSTKDLSGKELIGKDFNGQNLVEFDFSEADLTEATLNEANCSIVRLLCHGCRGPDAGCAYSCLSRHNPAVFNLHVWYAEKVPVIRICRSRTAIGC